MIPRVPKTKGGVGKSFAGTAQYLLHDEGKAQTSDRVQWTETLNLGVDDPELAARVMAATALDADRLKREHHEAEQAKLPEDERTPYRASKQATNHVFHYSLAWEGKTEGPTLTREEMIRAAKGSLRELGADTLQAVLVAHEAETNPHVHIMVNRVDPETGYTQTPESNAKFRLSEWALKYERERGHIFCKERERNAALHVANLPYEQHKSEERKAYEARVAVAAEIARNPEGAEDVREAQAGADRALGRETRDMRAAQRSEWEQLGKDHRFRMAMINREADDNKGHAERLIRKSYVPHFDDMRAEHQAQRDQQVERETTAFGKLRNVVDAVKNIHATRGESEDGVLKQTFDVLGNAGARLEMLKRAQASAEKTMNGQMKRDIASAIRDVENVRAAAIHGNYERFGTERADMQTRHDDAWQANRAAWEQRDTERVRAWQDFSASTRIQQDFANAAGREAAIKQREEESRRQQAKAKDTDHAEAQSTTQAPKPSPAPDVQKSFFDRVSEEYEQQEAQQPQQPERQQEQKKDQGRERKIDDD